MAHCLCGTPSASHRCPASGIAKTASNKALLSPTRQKNANGSHGAAAAKKQGKGNDTTEKWLEGISHEGLRSVLEGVAQRDHDQASAGAPTLPAAPHAAEAGLPTGARPTATCLPSFRGLTHPHPLGPASRS